MVAPRPERWRPNHHPGIGLNLYAQKRSTALDRNRTARDKNGGLGVRDLGARVFSTQEGYNHPRCICCGGGLRRPNEGVPEARPLTLCPFFAHPHG